MLDRNSPKKLKEEEKQSRIKTNFRMRRTRALTNVSFVLRGVTSLQRNAEQLIRRES